MSREKPTKVPATDAGFEVTPQSTITSRPGGLARNHPGATSAWRRFCHHWSKDWVKILVIFGTSVTVRAPALSGDRVWDDNFLVRDNPFIKSPVLIPEAFRHYLFVDSFSAHYRPVQNLSYMLDYFIWDKNTFGFHLTNVLLHAASAAALYFLVKELILSLRGLRLAPLLRERALRCVPSIATTAFLLALLWAVHPVHSAAIDYISGRADSLAFLFATVGWLLFLRALRLTASSRQAVLFIVSGIFALLALLSRETACIWLLLFLGYAMVVERRLSQSYRVRTVLWCAVLALVYWGCRQLPDQQPPSALDERYPLSVRTVLMARSLGDYARLLVFPCNLHMERSILDGAQLYSFDGSTNFGLQYLSILGLIFLSVLLAGCVWSGRGRAVRIFGAIWFLAAYFPISNVVQLNATVAEHWLYLPSVGFLIFVAGCALELPMRYRNFLPWFATCCIIALSWRSFVRSGDWSNEETFYKRTFEAGSRSARVALNLGQIYSDRKEYSKAEQIFRSILSQNPGYPIAQNNLGAVLSRQGKIKEAELLFTEVQKQSPATSKEYPRTWVGALSLADLHYNNGEYGAAAATVASALQKNPEVWDLLGLECEILRKCNHLDAALLLAEDFARDHWWHYGVHLALGRLYAQKGDVVNAERALRDARRLDVHESDAARTLVTIWMNQDRLDEALRTQLRIVRRHSDEPRQYLLLSQVFTKMGRVNEANAALAEVSRLRALAESHTSVSL
jgi:protein O-mannosyl-transferase